MVKELRSKAPRSKASRNKVPKQSFKEGRYREKDPNKEKINLYGWRNKAK